MKYRFGIVLVAVVSTVALWSTLITENDAETAADHSALAQIERTNGDGGEIMIETSAAHTDDLEGGDRAVDAAIADGAEAAEGSLVFGRASPAEIENALYQRIADQAGLRLTNLASVQCDNLRCSIVFTGVDANPQYVGEYGELLGALMKPAFSGLDQITSSS